MSNILEEKLREGDLEAVQSLLSQNVKVNAQNPVNGWTALHWTCKQGNERVVKLLLSCGADKTVKNFEDESASEICTHSNIKELLRTESSTFTTEIEKNYTFIPNNINSAPLNTQVDVESYMIEQPGILSMLIPAFPTPQRGELVLRVRIHGSSKPRFIEIEIPGTNLTYSNLLKICCEELEVLESQVDHITKLPDTRLRNDNDVKRLTDFQALEVVLNIPNVDKKLVLKVRIHGSSNPHFIQIEIPESNLTYSNLLKICCEELEVSESQVEQIIKLPDTRLRNDNDVKRLTGFQALEVVL